MFWRRKKDNEAAPDATAPEIDLDAPEPDPSDFELEPVPGAETGADPAEAEALSDPEHLADLVAAVEPHPEPVATSPSPAEPEATLRPAEPEGDLDAGLARTRGGFMSRLRGFLGSGGPDEASWDDVEETLIGGDVGAGLAGGGVERGARRRGRWGWRTSTHAAAMRARDGP